MGCVMMMLLNLTMTHTPGLLIFCCTLSIHPLVSAALAGEAVVDCDLMGRAFPKLDMAIRCEEGALPHCVLAKNLCLPLWLKPYWVTEPLRWRCVCLVAIRL